MNVNRVIEVQEGNAVHSLQEFLNRWWQSYQPDAILASIELPDHSSAIPGFIAKSTELESVNPFAPIMVANSALKAWSYIQKHPDHRLAVILRPCELRTFVELQKRNHQFVSPENVVLIGVDCLGTFPPDEFRRAVNAQGMQTVTDTMLKNATEGGLHPLHIRPACQMCVEPGPRGADMIIGMIGVDSRRFLLLIARDAEVDQRLHLSRIAPAQATEYQVAHREFVVGAISDTRVGIRKKMIEESDPDYRFNDLGSLLALFANCSLCGNCLQACPLYKGELNSLIDKKTGSRSGNLPLKALVDLSHWLASCSGCGMCEEVCHQQVRLSLLIAGLSHRIQHEIHYRAGNPDNQLPWAMK